jgi:hypothetical protein
MDAHEFEIRTIEIAMALARIAEEEDRSSTAVSTGGRGSCSIDQDRRRNRRIQVVSGVTRLA